MSPPAGSGVGEGENRDIAGAAGGAGAAEVLSTFYALKVRESY